MIERADTLGDGDIDGAAQPRHPNQPAIPPRISLERPAADP
jgi:hypothetical protein